MQNRTHVPKFGNWDANANAPAYTAIFEYARAEKGGRMINPNDPAENPALAAALGYPDPSEDQPVAPRGRTTDEAPHQRHEKHSSREDIDMHRQSEQQGRYSHEPPTRRPPGEVPANRTQGDSARYAGQGGAAGGPARTLPSEPPNRRAVVDRDSNHNSDRSNGEGSNSNHNTERSPAHPSYAGRVASRDAGRSGASPAWERRRAPSGDEGSIFAPGTPNNRSRLRAGAGRPEEPPVRGGTLPKFGAWDAKDPTAGDGFTMIFQKASVEKKEGGPVRIPQISSEPPAGSLDDYSQKQPSARSKKYTQSKRGTDSGSSWRCCFGGSAEE
ncbi:unnamed protein product [Sphagnum jensenii]|uniref:RIN4 pathogenic type III effector avirulence factor Avr cleavage site domain-containing protein n=1 Tax=Sphagnum jensenii TaxID=128206 RepID=A0ABP0W3E0_9BRYO